MKNNKPTEIGPRDLLPRLKNQGYGAPEVARRRAWLEEKTGVEMPHLGAFTGDSLEMRGNIENLIGAVQVPVGVVGPVLVHGDHAQGLFYVPMATTEGTLIRSYERGLVALTHAGGVQTSVREDANHTVPSFSFDDIRSAARFADWLPDQLEALQHETRQTTNHGKLLELKCQQTGRQVLTTFSFSTGDAHGMNMIMKATERLCRWILDHYDCAGHLLFSGNCSEKRPSGVILTRGKGKWVTAGAFVPERILRLYLHTTADELTRLWRTTVVGHLQSGSLGHTAHAANGLTALFMATGQDVANIANSACVSTIEPADGGIYISVTLPGLIVATVGGGTSLPTQQEGLRMMDCYGSGKARKLAEITAAVVLGGELSLSAAIVSGEFVAAHEQYGRNRPE